MRTRVRLAPLGPQASVAVIEHQHGVAVHQRPEREVTVVGGLAVIGTHAAARAGKATANVIVEVRDAADVLVAEMKVCRQSCGVSAVRGGVARARANLAAVAPTKRQHVNQPINRAPRWTACVSARSSLDLLGPVDRHASPGQSRQN
jgi:hypothetical protein